AFLAGAPIVHDLKLTVPATVVAGQPFSVSVTAENDRGNPVTSYSGTVHFSSSDTSTGAVMPADSTLLNGQGSFSATLPQTGAQTLTVADAANNLTSTANLTVNPTPATALTLTGASAVAGQAFTVTVTARDGSGNIVTNYSGTVHFSSSDTASGVVLPADSSLVNGQGSFSVTLVRAGAPTLNDTDAANNLSATANMTVTAALASKLVMASGTATTAARSAFGFPVTAQDPFGNTDSNYADT